MRSYSQITNRLTPYLWCKWRIDVSQNQWSDIDFQLFGVNVLNWELRAGGRECKRCKRGHLLHLHSSIQSNLSQIVEIERNILLVFRIWKIYFTQTEQYTLKIRKERSPASAAQLNSIQPGNRHVLQCLTIFYIFGNILYYLTIFDHISPTLYPQNNSFNLKTDLFCTVSDCQNCPSWQIQFTWTEKYML